ncbi:MAG: 1-acyl-sn-glycerol-3-phosphate acyltransferase [Duncaniella sp.]|nr:1-acyl-sn-glycerol-3-phosphate acyltransferase [Duncaniella sp.]
MESNYDFSDIAPYDNELFKEKLAALFDEPGFRHAVSSVLPEVDFDTFLKQLEDIPDKDSFQRIVMGPILERIATNTTDGITYSGLENIDPDKRYTYITNHRDIILDSAFLNLGFLRNDMPTSEIAIGDNLLIYEWINDLVRINKSFIVKRNLSIKQALEAAKQLSAYIHYAVCKKGESVWIAQREGRAKDSTDNTQESVLKMLALAGDEATPAARLAEINIAPATISYEFDPNDYLKVREFLLRHRDPDFKKTQHDDLFSMETGVLQHKGRVHVSVARCISPQLLDLPVDMDKAELYKTVAHMIDCRIHSGYKIFPINYIAYDHAFDSDMYADRYTPEEEKTVMDYIESRLDLVDLPDITPEERDFMRKRMWEMYANPLKNKLTASTTC